MQFFFPPLPSLWFCSCCVFSRLMFLSQQDVESHGSSLKSKSLVRAEIARKRAIPHSNDTPGTSCKSTGKRFTPGSQLESRRFSERWPFCFFVFFNYKSESHKLSYRPHHILAFVRYQADRDTKINKKPWKGD